jgi:serine/threonine-protein kinase
MVDRPGLAFSANEIRQLLTFMLEMEKWERAKEILHAALELPVAERQEFVRREAGGDDPIRIEVESLLEAHDEATGFLVTPAVAITDFLGTENPTSAVGKQIGAYVLVEELGRGGMGAVYLAQRADAEFHKLVAVKLIKPGLDTDEVVTRFRNERQILANLEHPHIARLLDGGATADSSPFLVMEYVEGLPLTRYAQERNLSLDERLKLFLQICSGVQYAHRNLVVHRDLKPTNILVTADGVVKLLDFGIAKLLLAGSSTTTWQTGVQFNVMTPEYASPEQARGEAVTTSTDVYSLGVVLYELLTGDRPYSFSEQSLESMVHTVCHSEPLRPSALLAQTAIAEHNDRRASLAAQLLRGDLDNIVLMAMRKEPERRYLSVEQFAEDLQRYLRGLPVIAREDTFSYRAGKFLGRNKVGVAAAAGVAISLIAGLSATSRQARIARRQRDKAEKINRFLQRMLASADPRAAGKDAKVVEVLQLAADAIAKDFTDQPDIVADLSTTTGLTFLSLGQIEPAEQHLNEALRIRCSLFGLDHHDTAMSLSNCGKLSQAKGELQAAEKLYRHSLSILRGIRRTDPLDLAAVLGNLGFLLMLEGNYTEAKAAHREELEILRDHLGEEHPDFARTLGNLANIFSVTGDKQIAESMHRQALALTQDFYQREHPDVALAMLHLAITVMTDLPEEAEDLFRQTLAMRRRFFGNGHSETAWPLYYLGDVLMRKKDYPAAIGSAREILSWRENMIPETHSVINSTMLMLARCHLATGRPEQAEALMRECLKLRHATLPQGHWLIATAEGYLAECMIQMGRFGEAAPLLDEAYRLLLAKLGADHEHTLQAEERLSRWSKLARARR